MIIDCHVHIKGGDLFKREFPPEFIVEMMNDSGVDKSVIFSMALPSYESNELTRRAYERFPDRFIPFGHVLPEEGELALREIDRVAKELKWRGLKLHFGEVRELTEKRVAPVFEAAFRNRLPCLVDAAGNVGVMESLTARFSDGIFIIAHLGSPNSEALAQRFIELALRRENVFLDTSYSHCYWKLADAYRVLGARKLIWGSDAPLMHPRVELEKIRILKLPDADEERILSGNIREILQLNS